MKRIAIILTVLAILFSSTIGVSAASDIKDINLVLSDTAAVIKLGETLELTATTEKHGSDYIDAWGNAVKTSTEFDSYTGSYISKASFSASKPGIYTISYEIKMTSGNGNTVFFKKAERTVEVIDPLAVVSAVIKDITVTPIYKQDGSISAYSAFGTTHALWSNNTTTPNGTIFFFFGPDETTKDISVTLNINCKQYTYMVTVNR